MHARINIGPGTGLRILLVLAAGLALLTPLGAFAQTSSLLGSSTSGEKISRTGAQPVSRFAEFGQIEEMIQLPAGSWRAARMSGSDGFYLISDNGRFVIDVARGRALDTFSGRAIQSFDDARWSATHMTMDGLPDFWSDLEPMEIGTGTRRVAVFVDPYCPYCHELLRSVDPDVSNVTLMILPVPFLGQRSGEAVTALHCATDSAAAVEALRSTRFHGLERREGCGLEPVQRRMVAARMLGVRGVPFMLDLDSGRFVEGIPRPSPALWLETVR